MHDLKQVVTDITNLLAAQAIAHPNFPDDSTLPRAAKIPSSNVGHQPLLDYRRLNKILWGTVALLEEERKRRRRDAILIGLAMAAWLLLLKFPWWIVAPLSICVALLSGVYVGILRRASKIRAAQVSLLLEPFPRTKFRKDAERQFVEIWEKENARLPWANYGDGLLSEERALVFFTNGGSDPFPGLGWIQVKSQFVCPPAREEVLPTETPRDLMALARHTLSSVRNGSYANDMRTGVIVVVDSDTVTGESCYLCNEEPLLYIDASHYRTQDGEDPLALEAMPSNGSARAFAGLQALFPACCTLITFAVRFSRVGASVVVEVLIATLGPPVSAKQELLRKLYRHRGTGFSIDSLTSMVSRSGLARHLFALRHFLGQEKDTFGTRINYSGVRHLQPFDAKLLREESLEASRIQVALGRWIGNLTRHENWREQHSLTLANDYFGGAECRAAIRAIYDHITRDILDRLEKVGYDISAYRDSSGRWTINADKIENMIVGERISLDARTSERVSVERRRHRSRPRLRRNPQHRPHMGS